MKINGESSKNNNNVNNKKNKDEFSDKISWLNIGFNLLALLSLIGVITLFWAPDFVADMLPNLTDSARYYFAIADFLVVMVYAAAAYGLLKRKKWGYYIAWPALVLVILRGRIIGLVIAVILGRWLLQVKREFLNDDVKKQNKLI